MVSPDRQPPAVRRGRLYLRIGSYSAASSCACGNEYIDSLEPSCQANVIASSLALCNRRVHSTGPPLRIRGTSRAGASRPIPLRSRLTLTSTLWEMPRKPPTCSPVRARAFLWAGAANRQGRIAGANAAADTSRNTRLAVTFAASLLPPLIDRVLDPKGA
jgi:hypothetical protein